jgi:hypothetical protein
MAKFRVAFKGVMDRPAMAARGPTALSPRGMGGARFLS